MYSLADRLGKLVSEVMEMTEPERDGWLAYLSYLDSQRKLRETR